MKKIVLAIDSFKGCLTSLEAEEAAAQGICAVYPTCEVVCLPMADGGEGMLDALIATTRGKNIDVRAHNPLMQLHNTHYGILGDNQTAIIEMATICGLPLVPEAKRNPMITTTFGTGELVRNALDRGCSRFIIGLGGSATNDAGLGMLQALGFRFLDKYGCELPAGMGGGNIGNVHSIDSSAIHPALKEAHFIAACDVQNPFYGAEGAAHIFAPQKGASPEMVIKLDKAMKHLAGVILKTTGKDISQYPGSGAAGGMGGGLMAFLNAELRPGIELLLEALHFAEKIKNADIIITGEGKSDCQTLMGKVPLGILKEAQKQQIPVILIAGKIEQIDELKRAGFQKTLSITPSQTPLEQAMIPRVAWENIRKTIEKFCRIMQCQ